MGGLTVQQDESTRKIYLKLCEDGILKNQYGNIVVVSDISERDVIVGHLTSHVVSYSLPDRDTVKVRVIYTSHCWNEAYDSNLHSGKIRFMDGKWPRAFCPERYRLSFGLKELIEGLPGNKIYMTPAERNFGTYNGVKILDDGTAYIAFFTIKGEKGRFDGVRHRLTLYVESAYLCTPLKKIGQKTGFAALLTSAIKGKPLSFKR